MRDAHLNDGRTTRTALALAAGTIALLVLGGCTATPTTSPTPSASSSVDAAADLDVCALLPAGELAGVLQQEPQATPVPAGGWMAGQCSWSGANVGFLLSVGTQASIAAFADPAEPDAERKIAAFRERASATGGAEPVPDIADDALRTASGMAARVGGDYLEITALELQPEQMASIMRLAVRNLRG